jgi:hypothetical protein
MENKFMKVLNDYSELIQNLKDFEKSEKDKESNFLSNYIRNPSNTIDRLTLASKTKRSKNNRLLIECLLVKSILELDLERALIMSTITSNRFDILYNRILRLKQLASNFEDARNLNRSLFKEEYGTNLKMMYYF